MNHGCLAIVREPRDRTHTNATPRTRLDYAVRAMRARGAATHDARDDGDTSIHQNPTAKRRARSAIDARTVDAREGDIDGQVDRNPRCACMCGVDVREVSDATPTRRRDTPRRVSRWPAECPGRSGEPRGPRIAMRFASRLPRSGS
jgi:hypothetical protein